MRPKVFVVSVVKDEADIIGPWCDHYASLGVEKVLILNGSADETNEILADRSTKYPNLFEVWRDYDPSHRQDLKMTRLCTIAHELGATWIFPVDADEFWCPTHGTFEEYATSEKGGVRQVKQQFYFPSCRDIVEEQNPIRRIRGHAALSSKDAKICFYWRPGSALNLGNHSMVLPVTGCTAGQPTDELMIHHYPYRSEDHFVAKIRRGIAALAAAPELSSQICAHWRDEGEVLAACGEDALRERYRTLVYHDETRVDNLLFDSTHFSDRNNGTVT